MIGQRFGRLVVLSTFRESPKRYMCQVRCDCGVEKAVLSGSLRRGSTVSCGCRWKETISGKGYNSGSPTHQTWENMHSRCRKHTKQHANSFAWYDGIEVCERWSGPDGYKHFLSDMGEKPVHDYHAIDRIDGTKGYSPDNCRWVTRKEQQHNIRSNRWIEIDGDKKVLSDWHRFIGVRCNWYHHQKAKYGEDKALEMLTARIIERKRDGTNAGTCQGV